MNPNEIPALPGSYALLLALDHPLSLTVGRMEAFNFPPATYVYFGSAGGPGGLKARLQRHILGSPYPHWHIDSFRSAGVLKSIYFLSTPNHSPPPLSRLECAWSQAAAVTQSASIPAPHFGASDCQQGCPAHLIGLAVSPDLLVNLLAQAAGVEIAAIQSITIH